MNRVVSPPANFPIPTPPPRGALHGSHHNPFSTVSSVLYFEHLQFNKTAYRICSFAPNEINVKV
jgi:hypothetical protein